VSVAIWDNRAARVVARQEAWLSERQAMSDYLHSPEWYDKRDRAFFIWRSLGWLAAAGPLVARLWFAADLHGLATLLLVAPLQMVCAVGFAYAAAVRGLAIAAGRPLKRVGHHLGYTHVDTHRRIYTERWYEIVPVTEAVNKMEHTLRRGKPSPGFRRYLTRTLIAIAILRFWWLWGTATGAAVLISYRAGDLWTGPLRVLAFVVALYHRLP
jgi:hypothetical protein